MSLPASALAGNAAQAKSPDRLDSIDQLRGLAILLMVLANYQGPVRIIPAWLRHTHDIGLTPTDLVAPLFVFAIGLTYGLSVRRRIARDGRRKTIDHFLVRYLAIVGIGALISAIDAIGRTWYNVDPTATEWGALQSIGVAGLLTLLVIWLPSGWRWAIGLALLAVYQILLDRFLLQAVLLSPHGGLPGSLGWAALLILSTAMADLFHDTSRSRKRFYLVDLLILLVGIGSAFLVPVSKPRVSASYILISLGVSGALFALLHLLGERSRFRLPILTTMGRNAILLYLLHYVLLGALFLPGIPALYAEAPAWLVVLEVLGIIAVLGWIGRYLEHRNYFFTL